MTPTAQIRAALAADAAHADPALWIHRVPDTDLLARAAALEAEGPRGRPLWGTPVAVKDNIDVAGLPTTAACPAFAYTPDHDAPAISRLLAAGAIIMGKTNLDQFATGLVGVRSPYGTPRAPFDPARVPGGSSSGSGAAVAAGIVPIALGTDTAGSGRIPAAFGNIVGLKPTIGAVPSAGMVPACRSIDTISVFARTVDEALAVTRVIAGYEPADPYSRPAPPGYLRRSAPPTLRIAAPADLSPCDPPVAAAFTALATRLGATAIDLSPSSPSPASSTTAPGSPSAPPPSAPCSPAPTPSTPPPAPSSRAASPASPPTPSTPFTSRPKPAASPPPCSKPPTCFCSPPPRAGPASPNSPPTRSAPTAASAPTPTSSTSATSPPSPSLPASPRQAPQSASPSSAPPGPKAASPALADTIHRAATTRVGATQTPLPPPAPPDALAPDETALFCIGAHMSGLPLNPQLTALGARYLYDARTRPEYRLHALGNRPGLVAGGAGVITGEVWALPTAAIGVLLAQVPPPLGFGTVTLETGPCLGFLAEAAAVEAAPDITAHGGWRAYLARSSPAINL